MTMEVRTTVLPSDKRIWAQLLLACLAYKPGNHIVLRLVWVEPNVALENVSEVQGTDDSRVEVSR